MIVESRLYYSLRALRTYYNYLVRLVATLLCTGRPTWGQLYAACVVVVSNWLTCNAKFSCRRLHHTDNIVTAHCHRSKHNWRCANQTPATFNLSHLSLWIRQVYLPTVTDSLFACSNAQYRYVYDFSLSLFKLNALTDNTVK